MTMDAISRNSPITSGTVPQNQDAYNVKRAEIQARQAEELSRQRQIEQAIPQPAINAQGQLTGTLININA
ncbi:hypothetical protein AB6Q56_22920 (plasmid) [Dechloromonas sp. ARDL1]|uniref:hypothetical protein n=1 Tax=Dechloromonas sp. ARDL1 TaxID=3322121 RepID=UPI003DA6DBF1